MKLLDLDGGRRLKEEDNGEEEKFTGCYLKAVTGVQCSQLRAIADTTHIHYC